MGLSFRLLCLLYLSTASASAVAVPLCEGPPSAVSLILPELPRGCQRERVAVSGQLSFNMFRTAASLAESAWEREVFAKFGERFYRIAFAACKRTSCVKGAVSGTERCSVSAYPCALDMEAPQRELVARLASIDALPPQPQPDEILRSKEREDEVRPREEKEKAAAGEKAVRDKEERERQKQKDEREKLENATREEADKQKAQKPRFEDRNLTIAEVREMQRYLARAGFNVRPDGVFGDESRDALSAWERGKGLADDGYPTVEMLERLRGEFR